ncbi:DUF559 domain-containing protein [Nocardia brasiliensis]|uniref:DUF559 domain-containing protein n=1 Tax=Nocardia brasiliensis TaxID=37326 RepID=A0A6G9XW03_NOCBR|nr:DUF559 domain-containing protein [Nocardia brasiliensis]
MGALDEPFPGSWALDAGLVSRWELRHNFRRLFPDVYLPRGYPLDAAGRARAAAHWAKGSGTLIGHSAAALHGTRWLNPDDPAEIARPTHCKPPPGIRAVRTVIVPAECCEIDGFRVTTPARTAFDIGRSTPREHAVPLLDSLSRATGVLPSEIEAVIRAHPGARGIARLSAVLDSLDGGAESPPESHTRLLLLEAGLPRPTTQLIVRDHHGSFVARVDMGWERWRVVVEYDGAQHWTDPTQRTKDIDRIATLESLGWRVIRVNATLLRLRPHVVLDRVCAALRAHGWTNDQEELVAASAESLPPPVPPDHSFKAAVRHSRVCSTKEARWVRAKVGASQLSCATGPVQR